MAKVNPDNGNKTKSDIFHDFYNLHPSISLQH